MQQRILHCILIVVAFARLGSTSDYPLQPGWTAHVSGGRTYYYHQSTGRSTWERPSAWQQQSVPTQSIPQPQQQPQYQHQQQQYQQPFLQQQQSYIGQTGVPQPFKHDQQQQPYAQQQQPFAQQPVRAQPQPQQQQSQSPSPSGAAGGSLLNSNNHNISSLSSQYNTPLPGSNTHHDHSLTPTIQPKNESSTSVETNQTPFQPKPQGKEQQLLANELSMVTELRKADQQIDELNDYIDTLLEKIKVGEEERTALAAAAAAVVTNSSNINNDRDADIEVMNELSEKIDVLQTELVEKNEEMVRLQTSKDVLEKKLADTLAALKLLQGNFTTQQQEIKQIKKRGREQEKELEDCYREIGMLETDLKNVAGSSMKRLTQRPSFFARLWDGISSHNPWQFFGLSSSSSPTGTSALLQGKSTRTSRRAKGRLAAAHSTSAMNRTIATLRENITAMANALSSKETVISDLTEQLAENVEEAEKRRQAYAVLKDGLEELNEENERLTMDLSAREAQLNQSIETVATLRNQLATSTQDIHTEESKYHDAEQRLLGLATVVDRQETTISHLQQQVVNATDVANQLHEIILASRNHSSNSIITKDRPWYWFLFPWEW